MISALQSPLSVNPKLNEQYLRRLEQSNFVSYREIYKYEPKPHQENAKEEV